MDFVFKDKVYKVFKDRDCYLFIEECDTEGNRLRGHSTNVVERFFECFGIEDYKEWLSSIYGYKASEGAFPEWKVEDRHFMADRVLGALKDIYDGKSKVFILCKTNLLLLV